MTLTVADFFCGAGGSSTGAIQVPGIEVVAAANHWQLAVDTHNTNHPGAAHICADLSQYDPRYFPASDIGWFSPECTNHSQAKGKKRALRGDAQPDLFGEILPDAAAERSRATMWDVVRFTEHFRYRIVITENVIEAAAWALFDAWIAAMRALRYRHRLVMLNSMHAQLAGAGAAQSRDRMYVVFWREGDREPDLERLVRPDAYCPQHGVVRAMQVFKRHGNTVGRYRQQYLYRCPSVECRNQPIEPVVRPAEDIIDWTNVGTRIGDRDKPLAIKTERRIIAGIERYWLPMLVPVEGREGKQAQPVDGPMRTMTTRNETALAVPCGGTWRENAAPMSQPLAARTTRETDGIAMSPFIAELRGGGSTARPASNPLATVTASGNHHALVTPSTETCWASGRPRTSACGEPSREDVFNGVYCRCERGQRGVDPRAERHALVMRNNSGGAEMTTPVTEPVRTITTGGHQSLLNADQPTVNLDDVRFRMLEPREIISAMDFPSDYVVLGNRREQVRMAGNAVTPCAARDIFTVVADALT
ncbi:DNA cytosine methyltransferase [Tsukamurella pulmonis]|uniref:DNA cytosine methyltransferase n=1 Tax=Tsukamurella pulmonis TaxID=47312 RepID=UPI001EE0369C|nr:DNA cytosine methyltransferase [Tsukamurella pulmonis]BDD81444.1 DNA cytosine methyltransferase [Tsukamurella pulmonis]